MLDFLESSLGHVGQVASLGEELPHQAIGVLVGSSLPGLTGGPLERGSAAFPCLLCDRWDELGKLFPQEACHVQKLRPPTGGVRRARC